MDDRHASPGEGNVAHPDACERHDGSGQPREEDTFCKATPLDRDDLGIATIGMAAICAFYRELALVQVQAVGLLPALQRRDHAALETVSCEAVSTWHLARAALQIMEYHAGDVAQMEMARRALDASCRVLLFLFDRVRTSSAGRSLHSARLREVLARLEARLKQTLQPHDELPLGRMTPAGSTGMTAIDTEQDDNSHE